MAGKKKPMGRYSDLYCAPDCGKSCLNSCKKLKKRIKQREAGKNRAKAK